MIIGTLKNCPECRKIECKCLKTFGTPMTPYNKEEVIKAFDEQFNVRHDFMCENQWGTSSKSCNCGLVSFLSTALDTAYKAGEENGVEKSLEIIKRHKFESFQGRDVLMSGNQVLSEVKKVPDLIKMSELLDVVKTIEKVVLSKELK